MSYRGLTIPLPVGQQGFTGTENPTQAGPGHLLYVDGAELDAGIIRKEGGATKFNSVAVDGGAAIISGINWSPLAAAYRDVIFTSNGKILKDTGGGTFGVTMASGLSSVRDPPPLFVLGGGETVGQPRKLFCFSSSNQVQVALGDAATMAAITAPAADWSTAFPTFGIVHAFRLWGGGNASDPHRIYYSTTGNHQDFTGAGSGQLAIFPGEGDGIVAAVSFRGALIVIKYPIGVYIIDTSDSSPANWSVTPMTKAVGTLNQHTIIPIENDVLYADAIGGLHALSTTQEYGDYTSSDIGEADKIGSFLRASTNSARLRRSQGIWYPRKQQAWLSLPPLGSEDNGLRFVTLFEAPPGGGGSLPTRRFFMSRRDSTCSSLWLRPDADGIPRPAIGDTAGFIWNLDQDSRSKDGQGYPLVFETANTDFGFADPQLSTKSKAGQFLELSYEPRGSWDLTVEVFWDDILSDIILFSMGQTGASIGSFILDTNVLASSVVRSRRERMAGSGRRLRLVGENGGVNQDVSLASFHVGLELMDERAE